MNKNHFCGQIALGTRHEKWDNELQVMKYPLTTPRLVLVKSPINGESDEPDGNVTRFLEAEGEDGMKTVLKGTSDNRLKKGCM